MAVPADRTSRGIVCVNAAAAETGAPTSDSVPNDLLANAPDAGGDE